MRAWANVYRPAPSASVSNAAATASSHRSMSGVLVQLGDPGEHADIEVTADDRGHRQRIPCRSGPGAPPAGR